MRSETRFSSGTASGRGIRIRHAHTIESLMTRDHACNIIIIFIIITSNDDIQPSTVVSNQLPSGLVLVIYGSTF